MIVTYDERMTPEQIREELTSWHFIADSGHGWYRVPVRMVLESGARISQYSYIDRAGVYAYLEEDCDISAFMEAIGHTPETAHAIKCKEVYIDGESPIRNMRRYTLHNVALALKS